MKRKRLTAALWAMLFAVLSVLFASAERRRTLRLGLDYQPFIPGIYGVRPHSPLALQKAKIATTAKPSIRTVT